MTVGRHHATAVGDAIADRVGDLLYLVPVKEVLRLAKIAGRRPQGVGDSAVAMSTRSVTGGAPVFAVELTASLDGHGTCVTTGNTVSNLWRRFIGTRIQAAHHEGRQRDLRGSPARLRIWNEVTQILAPLGMTASFGTTTRPSRM